MEKELKKKHAYDGKSRALFRHIHLNEGACLCISKIKLDAFAAFFYSSKAGIDFGEDPGRARKALSAVGMRVIAILRM